MYNILYILGSSLIFLNAPEHAAAEFKALAEFVVGGIELSKLVFAILNKWRGHFKKETPPQSEGG
jgi:hypothetical protein